MAYKITANQDNTSYGIKKVMVDNVDELKSMTFQVQPGSTALVMSTLDLYMLNNHNTWVKIKNLKNCGGGGSSGNPGDEDNLYIWDGGEL